MQSKDTCKEKRRYIHWLLIQQEQILQQVEPHIEDKNSGNCALDQKLGKHGTSQGGKF